MTDLLQKTYNMVLGMHEDFPRIMSAVVGLEKSVEGLSVRVARLETGRSDPPPRSRLSPTDTGSHFVVETPTGARHTVPGEVVEAIALQVEQRADAFAWRGLKSGITWTAKNVLALVLAAVIVGLLSVHLGIQLAKP